MTGSIFTPTMERLGKLSETRPNEPSSSTPEINPAGEVSAFSRPTETNRLSPCPAMDAFLCVHSRDIEGLLDVALASYRLHYPARGRLTIVTNDLLALRRFLDARDLGLEVAVTADSDWLSAKEMELPGWFRQQIIKLRSFHFCETDFFCNLGADTILARPIDLDDLVHQGFPVLYYSRHRFPDRHWRFERRRIRAIEEILQVEARVAGQYTDFINDFFCFSRGWMVELDRYISLRYGIDAYSTLLRGLDPTSDQTRFGEWSLYSTFVLDCLQMRPVLRNAREGYLDQIHGRLDLITSRFQAKVIHIVNKKIDRKSIRRKLILSKSPMQSFI